MSGVPKSWIRACQALFALGAVAFLAALATGQAQRAWQAYLLNFLFWTGIAQCGVIFSAAYNITRGRWSDALRRMGESLVFFLPVAIVLFLVLMLFGASVFPWSRQPYPGRESWLTVPAVLARDLFVLLLLTALSALYVWYSQRAAIRAGLSQGTVPPWALLARFVQHTSPDDTRRASAVAPVLILAFALGFSLLGFDLVMSLDPGWYNTLFGWYFYVGAFYSMLATLAIAAAVFRRAWNLERHLQPRQSHDLGKLLFGICLLAGGFLWAQWLVAWYGNLPEEIAYVLRRYYQPPFAPFGWLMTYGGFVVPLVVLLSRPLKRDPAKLARIAAWILAMMWIERYVWIVPAIWTGAGAPLLVELAVTAGFLGGFGWGWMVHNRRLPVAALAGLPAAERH